MSEKAYIFGLPQATPELEKSLFYSRAMKAFNELQVASGYSNLTITITNNPKGIPNQGNNSQYSDDDQTNSHKNAVSNDGKMVGQDLETRAGKFKPLLPESCYTLESTIIPEESRTKVLQELEKQNPQIQAIAFEKYGLKAIEPHPKSIVVVYGPSGVGKTRLVKALANQLGLSLIIVTNADVSSPYKGETALNIEAAYYAAEKAGAMLFFDDVSIGVSRFSSPQQGSEVETNSICEQLITCLDRYNCPTLMATNLIENLDQALVTRFKQVQIPPLDFERRRQVWQVHLVQELPLASDVDLDGLAEVEDVCGRDIKNAVVDTVINFVINNKQAIEAERLRVGITQADLLASINWIKNSKPSKESKPEPKNIDPETEAKIRAAAERQGLINPENNGKSTVVVDAA